MSYLVLARRWRPQLFEDVVGQDHVVRTLANAITGDRLAHAYIFTGVRGVGKTSVARIFAKALNCAEGPTPAPCNKCTYCTEITSGSGVDVLEIDGASNTGVDDVRALRENVKYLPQSARYKVYIIDEVHMLSTAAFNALLKTLEEPPPHVIFVFATTEPHKIPTTILSRCQRFDLKRITRAELIEALERICKKDGYSIDTGDLALIVREAAGSMRDALSLLDQVVSFSGKEVPKGEVAKALGVVDRTWIAELVKAVITGDALTALGVVDRAFDHGYNLRELLKELVIYTRHVAVARESKQPDELIDLPAEEIEAIKELSAEAPSEKIQSIFGTLAQADGHMARVQDQRSILEMAIIKATHIDPALQIDVAINRLEQVEKRLQAGARTQPPPKPTTPVSSGEESLKVSESPPESPKPSPKTGAAPFSWNSMLDAVREEGNPLLEVLLESAKFEKMEDNVLVLSVSKDSTEHSQLQRRGVRMSIEKIASRLHGEKAKLKIIESDNPTGTAAKSVQKETGLDRALREEAKEHPLVKAAQEILEASIRDVRPRPKKQPANGKE